MADKFEEVTSVQFTKIFRVINQIRKAKLIFKVSESKIFIIMQQTVNSFFENN